MNHDEIQGLHPHELSAEEKRGLRYEIPAKQLGDLLAPVRKYRDAVPGAINVVTTTTAEPVSLTDEGDESILQEAQRLTHGPRHKDYGHPLDDYTRTAALISALLADKLKAPLTAEEAALIQCCVKLSRHINAPKRDNMTDLAGYGWVAWAIREERTRRSKTTISTKES